MTNPDIARSERLGEPLGMYSHGYVTPPHGRLLFVAGQLAVGVHGEMIGAGDFEAQMRQVFANFGAVLEAAEFSFDHVVKFTTYLTSDEDIERFYSVRAQLFPALFTARAYPPNTLLVIQRLVRPEFLIEVEGIAHESPATTVVAGLRQV